MLKVLTATCSAVAIIGCGVSPTPSAGIAAAQVSATYTPAATVLTLEGGLVGVQHLLHFTPWQLQGDLCKSPSVCHPVDYLALPGDAFNEKGADLLQQAIAALPADSGPVNLFGHSEGGQVIYAALRRWAADPSAGPDPSRVSWVSIGNPENPFGGVVEKLGLKATPRLPADTAYPGIEVIRQYDGWADFPSDRSNFLAVANAAVGALTVHPLYFNVNLDDPNNVRYTPDKPDGTPGNVTYVFVPNPKLPLIANTGPLEPMLDKVLRPIIEAGYHRPGGAGAVGSVPAASSVASVPRVMKSVTQARTRAVSQVRAASSARATGHALTRNAENRP